MKISWLALVLITFELTMASVAQSVNAKLISEIGQTYCEEHAIRIANLYVEIANNPGSRGIVVISGGRLNERLKYERYLWGYIKSSNQDPGYITEVRGSEFGKLKIQYWIVAKGAELPNVAPATWDFKLPPEKESIFLYSDNENSLCQSDHQTQILSEFLSANSDFRGIIIIHSRTMKEFFRVRSEIVKRFPSSDVLRVSFVHKRPKYDEPDVEWWLKRSQNTNRKDSPGTHASRVSEPKVAELKL
jgi:hypothetical protein